MVKAAKGLTFLPIVCSGTMSYIFNELSLSQPFSQVVWGARRRGYTEADPRDDISGKGFSYIGQFKDAVAYGWILGST